MKNLLAMAVVFIIILSLSGIVMGQTAEEKRRIEEGKREALERTELKILEGETRLLFDYGGWFNYRYDDYHDDDNESSRKDSLNDSHSSDVRFWMKASLRPPAGGSYENEHSFYMRLKDITREERPDNNGIDQGYDHDGPHVDYAYLILDLRPCWLEMGRRYFSVGQGISYSNVNDGAEFSLSLQDWSLKALVSQTLPHEDNIDASVPGYKKGSDRTFYGTEVTYLGIPDQGLYSYFLVQRDDSKEDPDDSAHDYTYDSEYIGLGAQGKIIPAMHYWAEIIKETGESYVYDTREKKDVDALGGDFGVSYDWEVYSHPNLSIEYAFGSGDPDRTSVTDTWGGNTSGDDTNFLYFGYLPAGYALSPRLSNIHFYKAGVLVKPLEKYNLFKNFTLGMDYYRYYKDKKTGSVYDTNATVSDDDIGHEIDLTISWQILSDLSCSLQYGHFMPGDAYPGSANDNEDYLSLGVTFMF